MEKINSFRLFLVLVISSLNCLIWIVKNPGLSTNQWPVAVHDAVAQNVTKSPTKDCSSHEANRTVPFLSPSLYNWGDVYSGMWWQPVESMLRIDYSRVRNLEQVTFFSFRKAKRVVQTADWLDFSVEHLSKYVKHFEEVARGDDLGALVRTRVGEILLGYIEKAKRSFHRDGIAPSLAPTNDVPSAVLSTIVILPLRVASEMEGAPGSHRAMLMLAATIASLWNVGFPRVVVAGIDDNEKAVAYRAFNLLQEHLQIRFMELTYIPMGREEEHLVPKVAMIRFQDAIRSHMQTNKKGGRTAKRSGNSTDISDRKITFSWLGKDPSRWKYIYFSEPDLLLHIRPEAVSALSNGLKHGNLLNAHRLQPLPHMHQFMDVYESAVADNTSNSRVFLSQVLPNLANFAAIHILDTSTGDACCDQGLFYPGHAEDPSEPLAVRLSSRKCYTQWAFCGFSQKDGDYGDWYYVLEKHELLLRYPFISLERGTGLPLVHHGQRVCTPKRESAASC